VDDELKHSVGEDSDISAKFYTTGIKHLTQRWKLFMANITLKLVEINNG
jgi:hypothetical protein